VVAEYDCAASPERSSEPPWAKSVPPFKFYSAGLVRHPPCLECRSPQSVKRHRLMKKCTYCGKEYPDGTGLACPTDGQPLVDFSPDPPALPKIRRLKDAARIVQVVVKDFEMTFGSMVVFMIKWALASIPAFIILAALAAAIFLFLTQLGVGSK
jgi:hypothetical protein